MASQGALLFHIIIGHNMISHDGPLSRYRNTPEKRN